MSGGFGRSNSLSINTGASNAFGSTNANQPSGSLFGASTGQPPKSGSLFGGTPATQPGSGGSGLFGSTTTTPAASGGGVFGNLGAKTEPPKTGGLFGSTNTGGGGLFGSSTQQSQPQQTGSLFGGTLGQQNQPQQQQQQSGGGLFGSLGQNKPAAPSLFSNTQTQTQAKPSLFGASTTNQPQQQPSLFGGSMAQTPQPQPGASSFFGGGLAGGLTLGQSTNQQQTTVPGVKIDVSQIRGTTRFNDLNEELQKQIMEIDVFIQKQMSYKEQCAAMLPAQSQNVQYIPNDVNFVSGKVDTVELALDNDSRVIDNLKSTINKDADDARLSFRAVEILKLPQQFHYTGMGFGGPSATTNSASNKASAAIADAVSTPGSYSSATDDPAAVSAALIEYFNTNVQSLDGTLQTYEKHISEIESHLRTVEASTAHQAEQLLARRGGGEADRGSQIADLVGTLRAFEQAILQAAERVGGCRESVVDLTLGKGNEQRKR